jgi:hypothetical protein
MFDESALYCTEVTLVSRFGLGLGIDPRADSTSVRQYSVHVRGIFPACFITVMTTILYLDDFINFATHRLGPQWQHQHSSIDVSVSRSV